MSMRTKKIIGISAIVVLLIVAQALFGGKRGGGAPETEKAASPEETAAAIPEPVAKPAITAADVLAVELDAAGAEPAARLVRVDTGWYLESLLSAPIDTAKVDRLLDDLVNGVAVPVPDDPAAVGLAEEQGIRVSLVKDRGESLAWIVGLRPAGEYGKTFMRMPGGELVLTDRDIRGDLGVWENRVDAAPSAEQWFDRTVFRFKPEETVRLQATYPDHQIEFERGENGDWEAIGYVPGGEWSRTGLDVWLADLSAFRVSGIADADSAAALPEEGRSSHIRQITVTLSDGREKTVSVGSNNDNVALVTTSDYPDLVFRLPEWRYKRYFNRMESLFPKAVPNFSAESIRFLDIRRGGETIKIARRGEYWRAVAFPYSLRPERVDHLVRLLSSWRPEDYAAPNLKGIRPAFGGPMVEVTLADGEVFQYRLAGRHPLFPWRYVVVNGNETFSLPDSQAALMFPNFADILDLGLVFSGFSADSAAEVNLVGPELARISVRRNEDGEWVAERDGLSRVLSADEAEKIVAGIFHWQVTGFHEGVASGRPESTLCRLTVTDNGDRKREITILMPFERDIPYLVGSDRGYLIDRTDFFNWMAAVRELAGELDKEAERQAEIERQAEAERQAEVERQAEAERQAEIEHQAEIERQAEAERQAEIERQAEAERQAEIERQAEAERQAEIERQAEAEHQAEMERQAEAAQQVDAEASEPSAESGAEAVVPSEEGDPHAAGDSLEASVDETVAADPLSENDLDIVIPSRPLVEPAASSEREQAAALSDEPSSPPEQEGMPESGSQPEPPIEDVPAEAAEEPQDETSATESAIDADVPEDAAPEVAPEFDETGEEAGTSETPDPEHAADHTSANGVYVTDADLTDGHGDEILPALESETGQDDANEANVEPAEDGGSEPPAIEENAGADEPDAETSGVIDADDRRIDGGNDPHGNPDDAASDNPDAETHDAESAVL